jgi:hypothetical protein
MPREQKVAFVLKKEEGISATDTLLRLPTWRLLAYSKRKAPHRFICSNKKQACESLPAQQRQTFVSDEVGRTALLDENDFSREKEKSTQEREIPIAIMTVTLAQSPLSPSSLT